MKKGVHWITVSIATDCAVPSSNTVYFFYIVVRCVASCSLLVSTILFTLWVQCVNTCFVQQLLSARIHISSRILLHVHALDRMTSMHTAQANVKTAWKKSENAKSTLKSTFPHICSALTLHTPIQYFIYASECVELGFGAMKVPLPAFIRFSKGSKWLHVAHSLRSKSKWCCRKNVNSSPSQSFAGNFFFILPPYAGHTRRRIEYVCKITTTSARYFEQHLTPSGGVKYRQQTQHLSEMGDSVSFALESVMAVLLTKSKCYKTTDCTFVRVARSLCLPNASTI